MSRRAQPKTGKGKLRWGTLAVVLCVAVASVWAAKKPKSADSVNEQKRALHALDRLTFGPRPGDVQAVAAMGVDKWIEQQLHPEKIDNSAMQARLAGYRTLQMSSREMLLNFPPDPVIQLVQNGKLPMPQDPYRQPSTEPQSTACSRGRSRSRTCPPRMPVMVTRRMRQARSRYSGNKTGMRRTV